MEFVHHLLRKLRTYRKNQGLSTGLKTRTRYLATTGGRSLKPKCVFEAEAKNSQKSSEKGTQE